MPTPAAKGKSRSPSIAAALEDHHCGDHGPKSKAPRRARLRNQVSSYVRPTSVVIWTAGGTRPPGERRVVYMLDCERINAMNESNSLPCPSIRAAVLTMVVPVCERAPAGEGWVEGPYPFPVANETGATTDLTWRSKHVDRRVQFVLYEGRYHLHTSAERVGGIDSPHLRLIAAEFLGTNNLCEGTPGGLLVLHMESDHHEIRPLIQAMRTLVRPPHGQQLGLAPFLQGAFSMRVCDRESVFLASYLAFMPDSLDDMKTWGPCTRDGKPTTLLENWGWLLARGTLQGARDIATLEISTERDFQKAPHRLIVVDPGGFSVLLTDSREKMFLEYLAPFQSVYADTLLLVSLQRSQMVDLALSTAVLSDPTQDSEAFVLRDRRWREIRNRTWWSVISTWRFPDQLLRGLQRMNRLDEAFSELADDFAFFSECLERDNAYAITRLNRRVALLSIVVTAVGVPVGVLAAVGTWLAVLQVRTKGAWLVLVVGAAVNAVIFASAMLVVALLQRKKRSRQSRTKPTVGGRDRGPRVTIDMHIPGQV